MDLWFDVWQWLVINFFLAFFFFFFSFNSWPPNQESYALSFEPARHLSLKLFQIFLLFLPLLQYSQNVYVTFSVLSQGPWIFCSVFFVLFFFFQCLFSLFSFQSICWDIFKLRSSLLNRVRSAWNPIKDILHFCYSVLWPLAFLWCLLRIFIFLLTLPSVLVYCVVYLLEPLAY